MDEDEMKQILQAANKLTGDFTALDEAHGAQMGTLHDIMLENTKTAVFLHATRNIIMENGHSRKIVANYMLKACKR